MKTLVTYSSKYGSTQQIAIVIHDILGDNKIDTELMDVSKVSSLDPYTAVIVGSAVYSGRWRRPAVRFLKKYKKDLSARFVWIFSSGPIGEGDPAELLNGWRLPTKLIPIAEELGAKSIAVFHGSAKEENLSKRNRSRLKKANIPFGDFRKWKEINTWAQRIAEQLKET